MIGITAHEGMQYFNFLCSFVEIDEHYSWLERALLSYKPPVLELTGSTNHSPAVHPTAVLTFLLIHYPHHFPDSVYADTVFKTGYFFG